jgi:LysM repeat protein/exonuclease VII small subunit
MAVAKELEEVSDKLDDAYDRLKDAVAARKEGAKAFEDLMRKPFGEPNELSKGLASGEATVDGIIGMYDRMREAIEKRFTEIGGTKKNELISYLTDQTAELVKLAKKRDKAATALDEAQKHLEDVLSEQKSFEKSIVSSMKSFGTALADLSKTDSDTTIKVIKTASGLVITQMGQTKSGVDTIVDKLKSSLTTIKEFTANIQTLLTRGYNKEYVRQLLEAGPEAAGATAALLAKSGDDTVTTINDLYGQINTASEAFGTKMSDTFYANSVSMAQAMVKGAQSEYDSIMAQMKKIADGIEAAFTPLADLGTNVGNDIIQDMINALEKRKGDLIALAQSIAAQIAAAMAAAASAIGVTGVTGSIGGGSSTVVIPEPKDEPKVTDEPKVDDTKPNPKVEEWGKATVTAVNAAKKVIVKSGDTLSAIAKANDTTVKKILAANPKFTEDPKYKNGNMIWAGTTVKIPTVAVAGAPIAQGFVSDSQNAARLAAQNTTIEKGAVTVNLSSNIPASDVEGVMTRSFLAALSAR